MKKLIVLLLLYCLLFNFAKTVSAANDHLVINQIQITGGSGKTANDYIEIFNPTSLDVDLNGYRLVKRTQTGTTDTLIKSWTTSVIVPANGFYLWANSNYTDILVLPDVTTSATISDDNGVALRNGPNDTGTIVDSVAWGAASNAFVEGAVFATNPDSGQVITRTDAADTDSNNLDFTISTANPHNSTTVLDPVPMPTGDPNPIQSPDPSPILDPTPPASIGGGSAPLYSSSVLISEFLPNPDGSDSGEEWIELYDNSSTPIDLSGWKLDDESKDGSIGSSAYILPSGTIIQSNSYLAIDLPEGSFALNNTGGDTVRLIWPDNTVVSQVAYTGNVKEDITYARKDDGTYDWTDIPTKGAVNVFSAQQATQIPQELTNQDYSGLNIRLNEIFPNPVGSDSGGEWVEVINLGTKIVTIHNWILDDGDSDTEIGSSAYTIQSPTLNPGDVAAINIPAGKFAMNNTGSETVRFFSPDKKLTDSVTYNGSSEGLSYARLADGTWTWSDPTPNQPNTTPKVSGMVINELFPYPQKGSEEFIELKNTSDQTIDIDSFKLKDAHSSYAIPNQSLAAGKFIVIKRSDSGIALANTAKEHLDLIDGQGRIVSSVEYDDASKNQSFSRNDDGDYAWTTTVTPNKDNIFSKAKVLGQTLVRTGNPDAESDDPTLIYFAIFAVIWYIAGRLIDIQGKETNEQTRIS